MTIDQTNWDDLANYRASLEHYGVPGMKWGIRKQRQSSGSNKRKSRASIRKAERAKKEKEKQRIQAAKEAARKERRRKDILNNPTKLYKHRNEFTYDEIKEAMKKFDWEKQLSNYSKDQVTRGAKFVGDLFTLTNNTINLYNAAARIANSVGDANPLPIIKTTAEITADKKAKKEKK